MNFSQFARRSQGSSNSSNQGPNVVVRGNPNPLSEQGDGLVTIGGLNASLSFVLEKILKNQEEIKKEVSELKNLTYQLMSRNLSLSFKARSPESVSLLFFFFFKKKNIK
mgnify:CR=1 FL=1